MHRPHPLLLPRGARATLRSARERRWEQRQSRWVVVVCMCVCLCACVPVCLCVCVPLCVKFDCTHIHILTRAVWAAAFVRSSQMTGSQLIPLTVDALTEGGMPWGQAELFVDQIKSFYTPYYPGTRALLRHCTRPRVTVNPTPALQSVAKSSQECGRTALISSTMPRAGCRLRCGRSETGGRTAAGCGSVRHAGWNLTGGFEQRCAGYSRPP
jgi:hypothetical protein